MYIFNKIKMLKIIKDGLIRKKKEVIYIFKPVCIIYLNGPLQRQKKTVLVNNY